MKKRMIVLASALAWFAILVNGSITSTAKPQTCEEKNGSLILNNQSFAFCGAATCFSFNQIAYCKCDLLKGDSVSLPFNFDNQNICTLNQMGKTNGFRASTLSLPEDFDSPDGTLAEYICPGVANKGGMDKFTAPGSYAQCDGGLCFTSTKSKLFPGFGDSRLQKEIICSCPISTRCDPTSRNENGYQSSGTFDPTNNGVEGGCSAEVCEQCNAAAVTDCNLPNPLVEIGIQEGIPVGAATGGGASLLCALFDNNVPEVNSCLCQCNAVDGIICTDWTVVEQPPIQPNCPPG